MERYPLAWPVGWKRTPGHSRRRAEFARHETIAGPDGKRESRRPLTVSDGVRRLVRQLRILGVEAGDAVISTNIPVRLDGLPYGNQRDPADVGVAVYFRLKKADRVLACDTWDRVADNLAAVAQHIDALRRIDRYGVGTLDQAFAGYAGLPAKGSTWRSSLGFAPDQVVTLAEVEAAFRERARGAHPDVQGGSHDAMTSLTSARLEAVRELGA